MKNEDPELWRYADHRERADKLIAEGKPLSVHFNGEMYVHGDFVHAPTWIGDRYVWQTLLTCATPGFGIDDSAVQAWRRRAVLS